MHSDGEARHSASLSLAFSPLQGLLSFLDVTMEVLSASPSSSSSPAAGGGSSARYGLLLHGTCPLPAVCMSTCTVRPAWTLSPKKQQEQEAQMQGMRRDG